MSQSPTAAEKQRQIAEFVAQAAAELRDVESEIARLHERAKYLREVLRFYVHEYGGLSVEEDQKIARGPH